MATVQELKQVAKELGVIGYSKMSKQKLMEAIEMKKQQMSMSDLQASASEPEASERNPHHNNDANADGADAFFVPSDNDAPPAGDDAVVAEDGGTKSESKPKKLIEFVSADNIKVVYRVNGRTMTDTVIVGWSKKDFCLHMYSSVRGDRIVSYATLITIFKKYTNGVHGDIARIVKAFGRIKAMPAPIKILQRKAKLANQEVVGEQRMENASASNRRRGTVDPEWLKQFTASFVAEYDRKPSGLEIRDAWIAYNGDKVEA